MFICAFVAGFMSLLVKPDSSDALGRGGCFVWGVGGWGLVGWGGLPSPGLIILLDQRVGTTFYFCSFAGDQGKNQKKTVCRYPPSSPWTQCSVGWSGGRGLAVSAVGLLQVMAVVVGGGCAGTMWKTKTIVAPLLLFLFCYFFVMSLVATF